ncbi:MAG: uncharacterized protein A8A55_0334 [Amphiamblys sp. WSBS2006]|nr:MAG: uncharacterized protein A8A55_0334 [Amphiamblys sp. WSBS2006]
MMNEQGIENAKSTVTRKRKIGEKMRFSERVKKIKVAEEQKVAEKNVCGEERKMAEPQAKKKPRKRKNSGPESSTKKKNKTIKISQEILDFALDWVAKKTRQTEKEGQDFGQKDISAQVASGEGGAATTKRPSNAKKGNPQKKGYSLEKKDAQEFLRAWVESEKKKLDKKAESESTTPVQEESTEDSFPETTAVIEQKKDSEEHSSSEYKNYGLEAGLYLRKHSEREGKQGKYLYFYSVEENIHLPVTRSTFKSMLDEEKKRRVQENNGVFTPREDNFLSPADVSLEREDDELLPRETKKTELSIEDVITTAEALSRVW